MANITLSVPENLRMEMDRHTDIRWSEVARSAILEKMIQLRKHELIRKYIDKEPFSESDLKWMDENDWHPVDEKQMNPAYIKSLKASMKEKSYPFSLSDLKK